MRKPRTEALTGLPPGVEAGKMLCFSGSGLSTSAWKDSTMNRMALFAGAWSTDAARPGNWGGAWQLRCGGGHLAGKTKPTSGEPAGFVQETLLNRCIRLADRESVCVI